MNQHIRSVIKNVTGAKELRGAEIIQNLWSNYGQIIRIRLEGSSYSSVVVKHVCLPVLVNHPRGWNTNVSHNRKVKSYQVETEWYKKYSNMCGEDSRIPKCLGVEKNKDEVLIILEDLDEAGFSVRKSSISWVEMKACLTWLASFHATFLHVKPAGLWETGTYWHLETRPDELAVLKDIPLKNAASIIDRKLKASPYQTLVHGDAKLANFCFTEDGTKVAAVDFQYVGAGVGVKDLAYFIGSCLDEDESEKMEKQILDFYFSELRKAIEEKGIDVHKENLEADWRSLFYVAWADFHRFMKGWSPGHWKINSYSERISREVIFVLEKEFSK